jgi:hypothetical protein
MKVNWSSVFHLTKIVLLTTIAVFLIVLLANAETTHNWKSSRSLCLADINMCHGSSVWYNAEDFYLNNPATDDYLEFSVCVRGDALCVPQLSRNDTHVQIIVSVLQTQVVTEEALSTIIDDTVDHNYFYCAFLVVFLCLISVCLTVLFDCKIHTYWATGQFFIPKDSLFMARVNLFLGIVISSLMIESAKLFSLMQDEECDSDTTSICSVLASDNLEIRSILRPPDLMVTNYGVFCISSAAFLLVSSLVSYLTNNANHLDHQVVPDHEHRRSAVSRTAYDPQLAAYWLTGADAVGSAGHARFRYILEHLIPVEKTTENLDTECAICLSRLYLWKPAGSSKLAWADSFAKAVSPRSLASNSSNNNNQAAGSSTNSNNGGLAMMPLGSSSHARYSLLNSQQPLLIQQATLPENEDSRHEDAVMVFSVDDNNGNVHGGSVPSMTIDDVINNLTQSLHMTHTSNAVNNNSSNSNIVASRSANTGTGSDRGMAAESGSNISLVPTNSLYSNVSRAASGGNNVAANSSNGNVAVTITLTPPVMSPPPLSPAPMSPATPSKVQDEIVMLICGHQFHKGCIVQWVASKSTCPVCRASLLPQEPDDLHEQTHPHV